MEKRNINLPQKRLKTRIEFNEKIPCALKLAMEGTNENSCSEEQKIASKTDFCYQVTWPVFMPQCVGCLKANEHIRFMEDNKNRKFKVVG